MNHRAVGKVTEERGDVFSSLNNGNVRLCTDDNVKYVTIHAKHRGIAFAVRCRKGTREGEEERRMTLSRKWVCPHNSATGVRAKRIGLVSPFVFYEGFTRSGIFSDRQWKSLGSSGKWKEIGECACVDLLSRHRISR